MVRLERSRHDSRSHFAFAAVAAIGVSTTLSAQATQSVVINLDKQQSIGASRQRTEQLVG